MRADSNAKSAIKFLMTVYRVDCFRRSRNKMVSTCQGERPNWENFSAIECGSELEIFFF